MEFMTCNTCRSVVQLNNTGICLACQGGFIGVAQSDAYETSFRNKIDVLKKKEQEIEEELKKTDRRRK